jgi:predicted DNA binding CopG/RHH family protein
MVKITISLPEQIIEQGKQVAEDRGATFSGLIRMALERAIKK